MKVAVIGAGRMGSIVVKQLPRDINALVVDSDSKKAAECALQAGAESSGELLAASDADMIAVVLPSPAVNPVMKQLAAVAKDGAVIMNMATSAVVDEDIIRQNPKLNFVDCKIIGSAMAMTYGAPSYVIVGTEDQEVFSKIAHILSGYTKVLKGDASIVPYINSLGSEEGIRCGVRLRKRLKEHQIPEDWEYIVLYSVAAGTLQGFASGQLGHFAQELAEKIAKED